MLLPHYQIGKQNQKVGRPNCEMRIIKEPHKHENGVENKPNSRIRDSVPATVTRESSSLDIT